MNRRFLYTILTIIILASGTTIAIFFAKGYRLSNQNNQLIKGTGIISITTLPDQASIFLDGHLTTASNANINSLPIKQYNVKIIKDGFIPWEKKVEVKEGLVTQIKATLFPAIPTVYPMTFNGVDKVTLSPDSQRVAFIIPEGDQSTPDINPRLKKSGVWVWEMLGNPLSFASGPEPHRIGDLISREDYSKASLRWSPDSTQVLINLPDRSLLFDENKSNDTGRDITATLDSTIRTWNDLELQQNSQTLTSIKDPNLRQEASNSGKLNWSPDQTKLIFPTSKGSFKLFDLLGSQTLNVDKVASVSWLPDSRHIVVVEDLSGNNQPSEGFPQGKISIMELDGSNKDEIYVGNFDTKTVFAWPDQSRLVFISSLPTPTAKKPNLFGVNLK